MHVIFDEFNDTVIEKYIEEYIEEQSQILNRQGNTSSRTQENVNRHEKSSIAPPKGWKSVTNHP